jgi:hypothetical protein
VRKEKKKQRAMMGAGGVHRQRERVLFFFRFL